jgi:hypothetical protein
MPLARADDITGPVRITGNRILDRRNQHTQPHRELRFHDEPGQRQCTGRATHVLLHQQHAARWLDVETARVEADALADERQFGMRWIAPDEVDESRCTGGRLANGMNGGIFVVQRRALHLGGLDAVLPCKLYRLCRQSRRCHVTGGSVDEVTRHCGRPGSALDVRDISTGRRHKVRTLHRRYG